MDRAGAIEALERARLSGPTLEIMLDLALAYHLASDVGAEVSAAEAATLIDPKSPEAWSAYAHALARTDRMQECVAACERALELGVDPRSPSCSNGPARRSRMNWRPAPRLDGRAASSALCEN